MKTVRYYSKGNPREIRDIIHLIPGNHKQPREIVSKAKERIKEKDDPEPIGVETNIEMEERHAEERMVHERIQALETGYRSGKKERREAKGCLTQETEKRKKAEQIEERKDE
jgi:hypothetical protein